MDASREPLALSTRVPALPPAGLDAARASGAVVIDLRTPAEYAEDHVPSAVNAPLFDDLERALVGTLYRRVSPESAFEQGRELVRRRIAALVAEIARVAGWSPPGDDLEQRVLAATSGGLAALQEQLVPEPIAAAPERAVVLCCWRGGMRSRSVTSFVRGLGLERAVALEGGYKGFRAHVAAGLAAWRAPPSFVLRGLTGVGKTLVLHELERLRPGWTIDLEGLADHRGSVLGAVGRAPVSQKAFETRLFERMRRGFPGGVVVLEGESRKVGDSIVPAPVWAAVEGGLDLLLEAPPERRVDVLLADYLATPGSRRELRAALPFLEGRLGRKRWKGVLVALLDAGRERELVEVLLERYYDPLYRRSDRGGSDGGRSDGARAAAARFDASDPRRAAQEVAAWIDARRAALART